MSGKCGGPAGTVRVGRKKRKKTKEVIQCVPNPALFSVLSFLSAMADLAAAEGPAGICEIWAICG
jgi:hypothetical protein